MPHSNTSPSSLKRKRGPEQAGAPVKRSIASPKNTTDISASKLPTSDLDSQGQISTDAKDATKFTELKLAPKTMEAIAAMGYTEMTPIQQKAIPALIAGRDVLGAAKMGSGTTLAFLVPAVELLHSLRFKPRNGTGAIIVSPTRELALQIFGVAKELMAHHTQTCGIVIDGANKSAEATKLATGVNLLIATPDRLLFHLQNTKGFVYKNFRVLVIDEANRVLDAGFGDELRSITKILPASRQTALFSTTQTTEVEELARVLLRAEPLNINLGEALEKNEETLEQGYVVCPSELRFRLLYTFLRTHLSKKKKVVVLVSSSDCVKFYEEALNHMNLPVLALHDQQEQQNRKSNLLNFSNATEGVVVCSEVAARGIDLPTVDWIVQFDAPAETQDYLQLLRRTYSLNDGKCKSFLVLQPSEVGILEHLTKSRVSLVEYDLPKLTNVQAQLERLIASNYHLNRTAKDAFRSYLAVYSAHTLRKIFDVQKLDLASVAKSFGFTVPPRVDLSSSGSLAKDKQPPKRRPLGSQPRQVSS